MLIYRLQHVNVSEVKQLLERISPAAESLAEDVEEGDKKRFLEGTGQLMARFARRIEDLQWKGRSDEAIADTVLEELDGRFSHDLSAFSLTARSAEGSVDWESTADRLVAENEWLREELERAERDYMDLYRNADEETENELFCELDEAEGVTRD